MDIECIWNRDNEESKILQVAWSESVMTIILEMPEILMT